MARGLIVGFFIVQIVALLSLVAGKGIFNKVPLPRDNPCMSQSSDKTVCVEWKYPLATACSAFVQCSASCLATTRWCPKLAGVWQYFSDASQSCVSPDTLNCADIPPPVSSRATGTPAPTPAATIPPGATVSTKLPLLHVASDQYRADTTFSVTRSTDLPSAVDVIDFDNTAFDGQTAFDLTTDTFTPVTSGLYWLHWTVGMPHFTVATNVTLHGLPTRISSLYRNPAHYGDTNSRTELVELEAGDRLTLSSTDTLRSNPTGVEISFSGFHLQSTMNPVVAFHGAMTGTAFTGSLTWDTVLVDTHGGFVVNYYYTIPVGGIWYVTLRCSDNPTFPDFSSTHLFVSETYRTEEHYYINHWYSDGIDTYSMSVIMNIPTGYNLGAVNIQGSIYGDADYPTAMLGFLYSPIDAAQAVAWYVAIIYDRIGPLDPLPFDNILQNVGSAWQADRHVFVAPHPGLYYITLSAMKKDSAEAEMELLLNEVKRATLYFPYTGYPPTRSRDIILRLTAGDELKIRLPADNGLLDCGSGFVCTTFGGFRLSA